MKRAQTCIAGILMALAVLSLVGVFHLTFIFPRSMAVWADEGRALTVAEQALANLSNVCRSFGLFLIPALLLAVVGCGVWAVLAGTSARRNG